MFMSSSIPLPENLNFWQKTARTLVLKQLRNLHQGQIVITESYNTSALPFVVGERDTAVQADIRIHNPDFYRRVLRGGSIGGAEAYIEGWWDSTNLTGLVEFLATNLNMLDQLNKHSYKLLKWATRLRHLLRRNSILGAQKNIHDHYDLGNELYQSFLDHTMLYSSALYEDDDETLELAQQNKMRRLCEQLQLTASDHVLEIGSGWGGMAIFMAQNYGCHVTTTTISNEQYDYAAQKIDEAGLRNLITLRKQDYRLLQGRYDKLVSIEMVEAVGKQYLGSFLHQCQSLLNPGGIMALQAITIADQRYEQYSHQVDFIQKYIFPGGFLPSVTALVQAASHYSDMVVRNLYDFGRDYGKTLRDWRARFEQTLPQIRSLGYDDRFIRLWRFYFCYCEGGFRARTISVVHLTLTRPG